MAVRTRRSRRGNTVIEAALVLPVLLLLAFGTVEYGYFFYVKHSVQGAAREAARTAIMPSATNSDVTTSATAAMSGAGLGSSGYSVSTSPSNLASAASGASITVSIQCTWGNVGVRPLGLISAGKVVTASVVMRKE